MSAASYRKPASPLVRPGRQTSQNEHSAAASRVSMVDVWASDRNRAVISGENPDKQRRTGARTTRRQSPAGEPTIMFERCVRGQLKGHHHLWHVCGRCDFVVAKPCCGLEVKVA